MHCLTFPCNVLQCLVVSVHGQILHLELFVRPRDDRRAAGTDAVLFGQRRTAVHVDVWRLRGASWRLLDDAGLHRRRASRRRSGCRASLQVALLVLAGNRGHGRFYRRKTVKCILVSSSSSAASTRNRRGNCNSQSRKGGGRLKCQSWNLNSTHAHKNCSKAVSSTLTLLAAFENCFQNKKKKY